ncbi:hypothetical protein NPIL_273441 [Nephila pilipes]|uniref:SHSP domain-containing protein n=1 Tax=Nephila pilipes TaxID=299642 RepID=A0A8X6PQ10_NEPPI|nr:hypothetical protein NPIL_273441 [Nephila pilipes]
MASSCARFLRNLDSRLIVDEIQRIENAGPSSEAATYAEKFLLPARYLAGEVEEPQVFRIVLNVKHFLSTEVEIRISGDCLVIRGEHDTLLDEHGLVSRKFSWKFEIPEDVDFDTFKSVIDRRGLLVIEAERKVEGDSKGKKIPIFVEGNGKGTHVRNSKKSAQLDVNSENRLRRVPVDDNDVRNRAESNVDTVIRLQSIPVDSNDVKNSAESGVDTIERLKSIPVNGSDAKTPAEADVEIINRLQGSAVNGNNVQRSAELDTDREDELRSVPNRTVELLVDKILNCEGNGTV